MALIKEQKEKIIKDLKEKIERQNSIVFVNFTGLKMKDLFGLRKKLKIVDSQLKIVKKTLLKIAFKEVSLDKKSLNGQVALIFGFKDEILPAKTAYEFSQKNENLKILGGYIKSQKHEFLNVEQIIELAKLPAKNELLAKLVGSIKAPISGLVNVLEGNIKNLIWALNAIKKLNKPY